MPDEFVTPSINNDYISSSYLTRVTQMLLTPTPGTDKARKCPAVVRACWAPLELTVDHYVKFHYATCYGGLQDMTMNFYLFLSAYFRELWSNFCKFSSCLVFMTQNVQKQTACALACDTHVTQYCYATHMSQTDCIYIYIYIYIYIVA